LSTPCYFLEERTLLKIEVKDTGTGMKPHEMKQLCKAFGKMESNRNVNKNGNFEHKNIGLGLGLKICKNICELLGGGMAVSSIHGEGTIFTFLIEIPPPITFSALRPLKDQRTSESSPKIEFSFGNLDKADLRFGKSITSHFGEPESVNT
jgi:hypothetical protein